MMERLEQQRIERNIKEKVRIVQNRKKYEKVTRVQNRKEYDRKVRVAENRKEYKRKGKNSIEQKGILKKR